MNLIQDNNFKIIYLSERIIIIIINVSINDIYEFEITTLIILLCLIYC